MRAVLASVFGDVAFMGFQHGLVGVQEVIQAEDFQRNKGCFRKEIYFVPLFFNDKLYFLCP